MGASIDCTLGIHGALVHCLNGDLPVVENADKSTMVVDFDEQEEHKVSGYVSGIAEVCYLAGPQKPSKLSTSSRTWSQAVV